MVYTPATLDALDAAIAAGALTVNYGGLGSVTYRSLADLRAARRAVANAITVSNGLTPQRRLKLVTVKDL
jgi:hypothetical protein